MKEPLGLILAGGRATRMGGGDKGLLPLGQETILGHVIARLAPQVAALALSANGPPARLAHLALPVLPDSLPGHVGPLAGILAGLDWAEAQGADHIVSAAADTPFLPCDLVPQLIHAAQSNGSALAIAATADGPQPTFGLWPVTLRQELRAALGAGQRKVSGWADAHGAARAHFADPAAFFNVNTPDDLARARAML